MTNMYTCSSIKNTYKFHETQMKKTGRQEKDTWMNKTMNKRRNEGTKKNMKNKQMKKT